MITEIEFKDLKNSTKLVGSLRNTHYEKYVSERLNATIIENEFGFVVFSKKNKELFIDEFFIEKESRLKGKGKLLLSYLCSLAKKEDLDVVTANIFLNDPNATGTLAGALLCGFKINQANNVCISLYKKVGGLE